MLCTFFVFFLRVSGCSHRSTTILTINSFCGKAHRREECFFPQDVFDMLRLPNANGGSRSCRYTFSIPGHCPNTTPVRHRKSFLYKTAWCRGAWRVFCVGACGTIPPRSGKRDPPESCCEIIHDKIHEEIKRRKANARHFSSGPTCPGGLMATSKPPVA